MGMISAGCLLGEILQGSVDKNLLPDVGIIIIASLIPIVLEILKNRKAKES
jgi:hypothetical protein